MARINKEDYYDKLHLLSPQKALSISIHTIGNHVNSIGNATELLRMYLEDRDNLPPQEQIDRILEILANNTQDLAEVLSAMGKYNETLK
ncbi:MAG: hypothetical protein AAFV33_23740, partial [Chloroflexota bacterium]